MNKSILFFTIAAMLATGCGGGGGSSGFSSVTPAPTDPAPEDPGTPPVTPPTPNVLLSYDGAGGKESSAGFGAINITNQLSPSIPVDCRLKEGDKNSELFVSMGLYLNPVTCAIWGIGREGPFPPTEFTIEAVSENGIETAKVTLAIYPRNWKAEFGIVNIGADFGLSVTWKEMSGDFGGGVEWLGTKAISSLAAKDHMVYVLFADSTHQAFWFDGVGTLNTSGATPLPGSFDQTGATVQVQTRWRFRYDCSGNGIRLTTPHYSAPNLWMNVGSPIFQSSTPRHIEYDMGGDFIRAFNADGSVYKYEIDPLFGTLSFLEEDSNPPPMPGMPSCSTDAM